MTTSPLLFGVLLSVAVMLVFVGMWRAFGAVSPVQARLAEIAGEAPPDGITRERRKWTLTARLLNGFGLGPGLAAMLGRAGIRMTAPEFALITFACLAGGFALGSLRGGAALGLMLGIVLALLPLIYVRRKAGQRTRLFAEQIPDVLSLLIGSLRAGHGMMQALETVVNRVPSPSADEYGKVVRAVTLGQSLQRALNDLAERAGSEDLVLLVTAVNVQYETGGDLAQTLDTISETIRDRVRIKRDIRVFTAQQRLSGYLLAALPVVLGLAMYLLSPEFMGRLFEPGIGRLLLAGAVLLQITGFLVIRKILEIEV